MTDKVTKRFKNMKFLLVLVLAVSLLGLSACSKESGKEQEGQKGKLVLADPQWDSVAFHNTVAQIILEKGYGYQTEIMSGSTPATFTGLENGDIDIYMETWVQNIQQIYNDAIDSGKVVELSTNFDDNRQGLYVPTYVIEGDPERGIEPMAPDLKTVEDLKKYPEVFTDDEDPSKGRIYGAPSGWEVGDVLEVKYKAYGLDEYYNYFNPGSSSALAVSLGTSYENGDPWVGYYWEPEWVMSKYDLTLLEDEPYDEELWSEEAGYACEWPSVDVTITVHKDVIDKAEDVVEFLSAYKTDKELNNTILAYMQDNDVSAEEAAKWFLREYEDLWTSWVPEEIAEKVKTGL